MLYITMTAAGFLPFLVLMVRRRSPALLATFFVAGGIILTGDYVVAGLLEMYHYRPGLMASLLSDSALGTIFAEMLFVPAIAVLQAAFLPTTVGLIVGTGLVTGIEILFLSQNFVVHNGWSTWYTVIGFPPYFLAVRAYLTRAQSADLSTGVMTTIARFGILSSGLNLMGVLYTWFFPLITYKLRILPTFARNQTLGWGLTDALFATPLLLWVLGAAPSKRAPRVAAALLALFIVAHVWRATGVWTFLGSWNPVLHVSTYGLLVMSVCAIDNLIQRWAKS